MASRPQYRGSRFEREVADYLAASGFEFADRKVRTEAKDTGDIAGIRNWTLELKAPGKDRPLNLSQAMNEAKVEAANAKTAWYAAIVNRWGKGVAESYVVMPLGLWVPLVHKSGSTDRPFDH